MPHNDIMQSEEERMQTEDEEQAFFRCVELVEIARWSGRFSARDIEDLIYHLGVKEYFK